MRDRAFKMVATGVIGMFALATSASAFDMKQTVDATVPPAYPFRILDAFPGMTFAEMQAAMAVKELELAEASGRPCQTNFA